ncbi:MAG: GntR family transcriptional regulator [Chloroflexi bacterium]|nr:GntR family transcriptional regulator [Chloroflexota bacterium]
MRIRVDKSSGVPYYQQIKESVRTLIAHGSLKPGDMLPTEFGLSEQLRVSRLVVHRALHELVTEGLLIRQRAKGTFVAPPARRSYTIVGPLFGTTESLAKEGLIPQNRILVQEVIPATDAMRSELALSESARVVHLTSLRLIDGLPLAIEDMYFPAERFPALADLDMNNRSVYATLERLYGAQPQEATDVVSAGSATRDEARLLGINKGAPVMRVQRASTDRQGLPVEVSKVVFHAERYQFVARMQRTG